MKSLHHKPIKRFSLSGEIGNDALIPRLQQEYKRLLSIEMRVAGYAQRLDIDSDFTIHYNEEREVFDFELSMYGVFVGKKHTEEIIGVDGTKAICIHPTKSEESLRHQEFRYPPN